MLAFLWLALPAVPGSLVMLFAAVVSSGLSGGDVGLFVRFATWMCKWWFTYTSCIIEVVCGIRIVVDPTSFAHASDKRVVVICNHRSDVDWAFLWCVAARLGRPGDLVYVLMEDLKKVPFLGWAMQGFGFVFISRNRRDRDLAAIRDQFRSRRTRSTFAVVFPEGRVLIPRNLAQAQQFGATLTPPVRWENVLIPKAAGTSAIAASLCPDAVYDLTIRYETRDDAPPSASKLWLKGIYPKAVHVSGERVDAADLPTDDDAWKTWLLDRFKLKESALARPLRPRPATPPTYPYRLAFAAWWTFTLASALACLARRDLRLAAAILTALWAVLTHAFQGLDTVLTYRILATAPSASTSSSSCRRKTD